MNWSIWSACLVVFVSSACALVIELIAGRIMAPYIGVSLYTWTSIIGVVLAGMSVGNYLGGLVADRRASRRTLGLVFVAGSVASLGILVATQAVIVANLRLSFLLRIVFDTTAIFFLPSLVLGMISPIVVKLALADLGRAGNTVGTIYACSTVGSIVGTFLTGFWLISWLGSRAIVWLVAVVLLLMGLVIGEFFKPWKGLTVMALTTLISAAALWLGARGIAPAGNQVSTILLWAMIVGPPLMLAVGVLSARMAVGAAAFAVVMFAAVHHAWSAGAYRSPCNVESNYYCIQILETTENGHPARVFMLDRLIHSFVVLDDPTVLEYGYERAYADLTETHVKERPQFDTLFIGGGGFTFPRYVEAIYPQATIDVMEIDRAVIEAAHRQLGLASTSRIRSFTQDARMFLAEWSDPKRYDVVYGDAFNDLSIPYHLTTVEFNRIVATRLKPDGIYLANVIDKLEGGEFLKAYANSLHAVFPYVYVFGRSERLLPFDRNTYVLMASRQPLDRAKLEAVGSAESPSARTTPLPDARLKSYLTSGRALTLTDDFAPVDQLLARLFLERGE
jgi:spermidine synthase/MFS family permease